MRHCLLTIRRPRRRLRVKRTLLKPVRGGLLRIRMPRWLHSTARRRLKQSINQHRRNISPRITSRHIPIHRRSTVGNRLNRSTSRPQRAKNQRINRRAKSPNHPAQRKKRKTRRLKRPTNPAAKATSINRQQAQAPCCGMALE